MSWQLSCSTVIFIVGWYSIWYRKFIGDVFQANNKSVKFSNSYTKPNKTKRGYNTKLDAIPNRRLHIILPANWHSQEVN